MARAAFTPESIGGGVYHVVNAQVHRLLQRISAWIGYGRVQMWRLRGARIGACSQLARECELT